MVVYCTSGEHPIVAAAITRTVTDVAAITVEVALQLPPPPSPEHDRPSKRPPTCHAQSTDTPSNTYSPLKTNSKLRFGVCLLQRARLKQRRITSLANRAVLPAAYPRRGMTAQTTASESSSVRRWEFALALEKSDKGTRGGGPCDHYLCRMARDTKTCTVICGARATSRSVQSCNS